LNAFARNYAIRRSKHGIRRPRAASQPYWPGDLLKAYGWPTGIAVEPVTIVIGELGGAWYPNDLPTWSQKSGMIAPVIKQYLLPGADNSPGDADGEVCLDWQCATQVWEYMTGTPANILFVYGPNSGSAFTDCVNYANSLPNIGAFSWSWGSPESQWGASDLASLLAACTVAAYPVTAASGDNDSSDGTGATVVDAPSCLPSFIACGGTSRPPSGPETVWNNGGGEGTGGGFSKIYTRPPYQPVNSQGTGRMTPDVAAVADPDTGYEVLINGQWEPIGGTSAVAPLMAGFFAVVNGARLKAGLPMLNGPQLNAMLWGNPGSFMDITSGNNGFYRATTGPDPCSGLGRALGTLFFNLTGNVSTPTPTPFPLPPAPNPVPSPPSPIPPVPSPVNVQQIIDGVFAALMVQFSNNPWIEYILKVAKKLVDDYLAANPQQAQEVKVGIIQSGRVTWNQFLPLINAVFAGVEKMYPAYAQILAIVQPLVDGWISTH
jgi:kumamolisin